MRNLLFFLSTGLIALLTACTPMQTSALRQQSSPLLKQSVSLPVPNIVQEDYQCGPASLAMLLQVQGVDVTPATLKDEIYIPGRRGAFSIEVEAAARHHGRLVYHLAPSLMEVLNQLHAGRPVMVLENRALSIWPLWHFAVVSGYDDARQELILHSGREVPEHLPLSVFENIWKRGGFWAIVLMDPAGLPADLSVDDLLKDILKLERGNPEAALLAYRSLLQRAPENTAVHFALANLLRMRHEDKAAEQEYRAALSRSQGYWPALNNLADLLLSQGRLEEALPLSERAAALAPDSSAVRTLQQIRAGLSSSPGFQRRDGN